MRIIIDGDACPSIPKIEKIARKHNVEVIIYCDINHSIFSEYSTVRIVDAGFQSADIYIVNEGKKGDIVITGDYGVAAMCLGKGCNCISTKGKIYSNENIDILLEERHMAFQLRKGGNLRGGPKKRTREEDEKLIANLEKLILTSIK